MKSFCIALLASTTLATEQYNIGSSAGGISGQFAQQYGHDSQRYTGEDFEAVTRRDYRAPQSYPRDSYRGRGDSLREPAHVSSYEAPRRSYQPKRESYEPKRESYEPKRESYEPVRESYQPRRESYEAPRAYEAPRSSYQAPAPQPTPIHPGLKQFAKGPMNAALGGHFGNTAPSYIHRGDSYGIHNVANRPKALIANDGYLVQQRTDPHKRLSSAVFAKCSIEDPEEYSNVRGVVRLAQGPKEKTTSVWAAVEGVHGQAKLTVNALGDLRDGCESAGDIFQPSISASGFPGIGKPYPTKAAGELGDLYSGAFTGEGDFDLSGTHSAIGRSIVVSVDDKRVGCCVIGRAAGPKRVKQPEQQSYGHAPTRYAPIEEGPVYGDRRERQSGGYGQQRSQRGFGFQGQRPQATRGYY